MDNNDPNEIWRQSLNFAAMGTLFHYAGSGAKKLKDFLPKGAEKDAMDAVEETSRLGSIGKRWATSEEALNMHHKIIANQLAVGGRPVANSIMEEALAHLHMEGKERIRASVAEDIAAHKEYVDALLEHDKVRYSAVFSNAAMIKNYLDNKGWDITHLSGEERDELGKWIQEQIQTAGEQMNHHVEEVGDQAASKLAGDHLNTPDGQAEYNKIKEKYTEQFKAVPNGAQKAEQMAQKEFLEKRKKFIEKQNDAQEVTGIGNAEKLPDGVDPLPPGLRGSKPKYSYGAGNTFDVSFEDDRDLAGYVISGERKSAAHEDFVDYYLKQHPEKSVTPASIKLHGARLRNQMKNAAKNWDGEGKKIIHIPSTYKGEAVPKEAPVTITAPRLIRTGKYLKDRTGKTIGYSMSVKFDWDKANFKLAKSRGWEGVQGKKIKDDFWQDLVDFHYAKNDDYESATQSFVRDIREHLNPLKDTKLEFEKKGEDDYTNFLGFMYHYKDNLPQPIADKVEEALLNSPKMQTMLKSTKPTEEQLVRFGQAINNHIEMFMRSKWYLEKGERNIFRSTQPTLVKKTQWQKDLLVDMQDRERKLVNTYFPGRSKAMLGARDAYLKALDMFHKTENAAFAKSEEPVLTASMERTKLLGELSKKFKVEKAGEFEEQLEALKKEHRETVRSIR
jgi:hypothetical protein